MARSLVLILTLVLKFKGSVAPCHYHEPFKTWPLGRGILNREILLNDPPVGRGIFGYTANTMGYDGLKFYGNSSSYVDVRLDGSTVDYSLYFFIYPEAHGGCLLHYRRDLSLEEVGVTEYRLDMESDGRLTYSVRTNGVGLMNGGTLTGTFMVPTDQWSIINVEYDISKTSVAITADDWSSNMENDVLSAETVHVGPGTMRIASPQDGVGTSFKGVVSCLHYIKHKDICEDNRYETKCTSNWPPTTTTTTTSTSTSISTSTSTTTPTTTSNVQTIPTTPPTPAAPTTSTTTSTTSTSTPTTLSIASTSVTISPVVQTGWRKFNKLSTPSTFASSSDVISTRIVDDVRECLLECDKYAHCMTFSYASISGSSAYVCKTGIAAPPTQYDIDSCMFEYVN